MLSTDDTVVRVLRRVLSELEIGVEQCADVDSTIQQMTRQRFEAVIVDCTTPEFAAKVLRASVPRPPTSAPWSSPSPTDRMRRKAPPTLGAHFVLFKPLALERTRSSFRAVRALMKRERRRHARIPVELPVELQFDGKQGSVRTVTSDLGENGIAIKTRNQKLPAGFQVRFTLPGSTATEIDTHGEVAWEGATIVGIRFRDLSPEMRRPTQALGRPPAHRAPKPMTPPSAASSPISA